jgi:HEPN domain-containing protein
LCQQSSEKYLKALLEEGGKALPKIHDLEDLCDQLKPTYPKLGSLRRGLSFLTDFAVDPRYPGNWASKRQASAALRWAEKVRESCRLLLGFRPPRKKER